MATAQVNVIHSVLTKSGWIAPGVAVMDAAEAQAFAASGHLEILSIDGKPVVWQACCAGHEAS